MDDSSVISIVSTVECRQYLSRVLAGEAAPLKYIHLFKAEASQLSSFSTVNDLPSKLTKSCTISTMSSQNSGITYMVYLDSSEYVDATYAAMSSSSSSSGTLAFIVPLEVVKDAQYSMRLQFDIKLS